MSTLWDSSFGEGSLICVPCVLQALAKEAGANFINIRSSTLQSKWFGETQKLTYAVFSLAYKLQPCIVFIGMGSA